VTVSGYMKCFLKIYSLIFKDAQIYFNHTQFVRTVSVSYCHTYNVLDRDCGVLVDGAFEALDITDLSTPPDLPEVMKPQDSTSHMPD